MENLYDEFMNLLEREDREGCFGFVEKKLSTGEKGILAMQTEIIAPSLAGWECDYESDPLCIWHEHVRTEIVRGLIEICYPYVLRERKRRKGLTVAVVCPDEEEHEIGARIAADIFTLAGFDAIFVGKETPVETFLLAAEAYRFDFVAIGVTNYYNVVAARRMIERIRSSGRRTGVLVGGRAFESEPARYLEVGADLYIPNLKGIMDFSGELK